MKKITLLLMLLAPGLAQALKIQDTVTQPQCWNAGEVVLQTPTARFLISAHDGKMRLQLKQDEQWLTKWKTGKGGSRFCFHEDGKVALHHSKGKKRWTPKKSGSGTVGLLLSKDCQVEFPSAFDTYKIEVNNGECLEYPPLADLSLNDQQLAYSLAPLFRFHPREQSFPVTVEEFIRHSDIVDAENEQVVAQATSVNEFIAKARDMEEPYLRVDDQWAQSNNLSNLDNAKVYARVIHDNREYIDIHYALLFAFNGCQVFRTKTVDLLRINSRIHRFPWCNFGRHYGDWEHVTVRIQRDGLIAGVYTAGHGEAHFTPVEELQFEGTSVHPVIYVALNSHATYTDYSSFNTSTIDLGEFSDALEILQGLESIKTVDVTGLNMVNDRTSPQQHFIHIPWRSYTNLRVISDSHPLNEFAGRWGQRLNNKTVDNIPTNVPYTDDDLLVKEVRLAMQLGKLKDFEYGNGPKSPFQKDWWIQGHAPCDVPAPQACPLEPSL